MYIYVKYICSTCVNIHYHPCIVYIPYLFEFSQSRCQVVDHALIYPSVSYVESISATQSQEEYSTLDIAIVFIRCLWHCPCHCLCLCHCLDNCPCHCLFHCLCHCIVIVLPYLYQECSSKQEEYSLPHVHPLPTWLTLILKLSVVL